MKQIKNPYAIFIKINMEKIYTILSLLLLVKQNNLNVYDLIVTVAVLLVSTGCKISSPNP